MELEYIGELKKELVDFFIEMQEYRQYFKRKLYEEAFQKCYENHREMLAKIIEICEKAEDKDAVLEELSGAIPEYAHSQINVQKNRGKKEGLMVDYNMSMVTFVIPILGYSRNESCDRLIDLMIKKWNVKPMTMRIQKSEYEKMKNGFKSRLCYITTAVCASRNQRDDCYELNLLRDYRDRYLAADRKGEALIEEYYNVAPTIVNRINKEENAGEIYENIYQEYLQKCVHLIETGRMEKCGEIYAEMVEELEKKYLFS